jgi:hypothetical protein
VFVRLREASAIEEWKTEKEKMNPAMHYLFQNGKFQMVPDGPSEFKIGVPGAPAEQQ